MIDLNQIYNEDCQETLKRIPDNLLNLVITSPPYNMMLRISKGEYIFRKDEERFCKKYADFFADQMTIEDYYTFHLSVLRRLLEICPLIFYNIQIVTGSKEAWFKIIGELANNLKDIIVWDKGFGQPAMHTGLLNRGSELILVFERDAVKGREFKRYFFGRGEMPDIWRMGRGENTFEHGACFPEELVKRILKGWSQEGDVVYDPFMGSGTTAISCIDLNRNFIGSEIVPEYCEKANKRIKERKHSLSLWEIGND